MHLIFGSNYSYHKHLWRIICYLLVTPECICCCTRKHFTGERQTTEDAVITWLKSFQDTVSFIKERNKHTYCLSCEWTPLITHTNTVHIVQDLSCTCNTLILSLVCFVLSFSGVYSTNILTTSSANSSIHEGEESTSLQCSACNGFCSNCQLIIWTPLHK